MSIAPDAGAPHSARTVTRSVTVPGGIGPGARERRAHHLDAWLGRVVAAATGGRGLPPGVALACVGGLGRHESAPYGDVDLLLLHPAGMDLDEIAARVWYPIWDARLGLDHCVRTVAESIDAAVADTKVALGLLDLRCVSGDPGVVADLRDAGSRLWRRTFTRRLAELHELTEERHRHHGSLARLPEADLKEAAGGLRDVGVLRGIGRAGLADAPAPAVRAAQTRLLDVRDALHLCAGRRLDRLVEHEHDSVTGALGLPDADVLLRRVTSDAATIASALSDAWRLVRRFGGPITHGERRRAGAVAGLGRPTGHRLA